MWKDGRAYEGTVHACLFSGLTVRWREKVILPGPMVDPMKGSTLTTRSMEKESSSGQTEGHTAGNG